MDDLDPLQTPKRGQAVRGNTPASWHKGHLRPLSPFSPVGVRRRVSAKDGNEREDEGILDVETQKLREHREVTHRSEHALPTSKKGDLAGEKAGDQNEAFSHLSTREEETRGISRQQRKKNVHQGEKSRLSSPSDVSRTGHEAFSKSSTSLREEILSHQRIASRGTVGTWSTKRTATPDADEMLCRFDVIPEYGPCCGISRRERWRLAEKLGLAPPKEVMEALVVSRKDVSIFDQRLAKFGIKNPGNCPFVIYCLARSLVFLARNRSVVHMEKKPTREIYLFSGGPKEAVEKEQGSHEHDGLSTAGSSNADTKVNSSSPFSCMNFTGRAVQSPGCHTVGGGDERGKVVVTHFTGKGETNNREMCCGRSMGNAENTGLSETQANYGLSLSFKTVKNLDQRTNQLYTAFVAALTNDGSHLLEVLFLAVTYVFSIVYAANIQATIFNASILCCQPHRRRRA